MANTPTRYSEILPYISDEINTASTICNAMLADPRTKEAISIPNLVYHMNMRGMMRKLPRPSDGGEKWAGSIMTMLKAAEESRVPELVEAQQLWFSHITYQNNTHFSLDKIEFAMMFRLMRTTYADLDGMPSEEDFIFIDNLGGGKIWKDVTPEVIQQLIDEENERLLFESKSTIIEEAQTLESKRFREQQELVRAKKEELDLTLKPHQQRLNDAIGYLSQITLSDYTEEELQAYVDSITNSDDGRGPHTEAPNPLLP